MDLYSSIQYIVFMTELCFNH